jgi:glycosyltransferase involved in cell wall biosynthesis
VASKIRVLFVAHGHPAIQTGGAEIHAYELYQGFKRSPDFEPTLLARTGQAAHRPVNGTPFRTIGEDGGEILLYAPAEEAAHFLHAQADKRVFLYLDEFLRGYRPDVVHFQHTAHLGVDAIRAVRNSLGDVPIVVTLHEFLYICNHYGQMVTRNALDLCSLASPDRCHECFPERSPEDFFLRERFIKSHLASVDAFIAPSRFLLERYASWGLPRQKLLFLDYGRNVLPPAPPRPLAGGERRSHFGYFGQVHPFKGVLELLEAVRTLALRGRSDVRLYLSGANLASWENSSLPARYRELVADCGDLVTDLGPYAREELAERMALVDWIVVPSIWWENSPLVIQEAFMHRRPVICSDIGGMREKVTHGANGLHFAVRDVQDLARVLEQAADTDGLWEQLRAGIPKVFTMEESIAAHADIYRALLAAKPSHGAALHDPVP